MAMTKPTGDGFTRGLNRLENFLLWQILALALALTILVYGIGRFRERRWWRWLSRLPMLGEAALVLFVAGTFVFVGQNRKSEAALYQAESPKTTVATAPGLVRPILDNESTDATTGLPAGPPIETFRGV
jgi:hypothetical protein